MTTGPVPVTRLTGVYHADGSILGELKYVAGTLVGRAHCPLCDITHGRVREKARWRAERERLPVPFTAVHLDERSPAEAAASDGRTPCVLAHTDAGIELLLREGGFEPLRITCYTALVHPLTRYYMWRGDISSGRNKPTQGMQTIIPSSNRVLRLAQDLEARIVSRRDLRRGSSVAALAKKY